MKRPIKHAPAQWMRDRLHFEDSDTRDKIIAAFIEYLDADEHERVRTKLFEMQPLQRVWALESFYAGFMRRHTGATCVLIPK